LFKLWEYEEEVIFDYQRNDENITETNKEGDTNCYLLDITIKSLAKLLKKDSKNSNIFCTFQMLKIWIP
jgi:hypothetical protein